MFHTRTSIALVLLPLALPTLAAEGESCGQRLKGLAPAAIQMPYREFDQSPNGWRKIMDCMPESASLLDRYVKKQEYELRGTRWHLAQVKAALGEKPAAIELMKLSLVPDELERQSEFKWNSDALATAAFLEIDKVSFDRHLRAQRQATESSAENRVNLDVLERLERCWAQPYMQAYGCAAAP